VGEERDSDEACERMKNEKIKKMKKEMKRK